MPKEECRESRPVPFDPSGIVWACVADDILASAEVDSLGRFGSPLKSTEPRLLPFQRQQPPFSSSIGPPLPPTRQPLVPLPQNDSVAIKTLVKEVRALELKSEHLTKRIKIQDQIIKGFCQQEVHRKENQSL